jgi:tetratricopeptide (TPR) repeat protein
VQTTVVTPDEALGVEELFNRGLLRFEKRQYGLAARDLEASAFGLGQPGRTQLAWYRAGIARDESGELADAVQDFHRAAAADERSVLGRDACVRAIRLLVFLERWADAGEQAQRAARLFQDLSSIEAIVVKGALALDALRAHELDTAAREIEAARTIIEEKQFDTAVQLQRDVAVVYFALGELRRMRGAELRFAPLPPDFAERLERRCQLLLDAQSAYSMAMRAYDSHWSVMAGYRVSQLYEQLHRDLMQVLDVVRLPQGNDTHLFEAALRLRYTILLEKAAKSLEHTLALAERTDERSSWVGLAREAEQKLRRAMAEERAALARVPYSREQLVKALGQLSHLRRGSRSQQD